MARFLRHLRAVAPHAEIIAVDGGSNDGTPEICGHLTDHVITAPVGRAKQMNAGAKIASGDVFWFVHADSQIAADSIAAIAIALSDPRVVGGCFRLEIIPTRWIYRMRDAIGNLCVQCSGVALGDRGFFCRREAISPHCRLSGNSLVRRCGILSQAKAMRPRTTITRQTPNQRAPLRKARSIQDRLFLRIDHDALRHACAAFHSRKNGAIVCR